jgi:hypothetical protein
VGVIPVPFAACVAAAGLALSAAAWIHGRTHGIDLTEARYAAQAADANREARRFEQQRSHAAQEAQDALYADKRRAEAAASAAGRQLDRLRHALAQRREPTSDPEAAGRADAARERELLAACGAALADMGRDADRIAGKVTALQAWVRGVCADGS